VRKELEMDICIEQDTDMDAEHGGSGEKDEVMIDMIGKDNEESKDNRKDGEETAQWDNKGLYGSTNVGEEHDMEVEPAQETRRDEEDKAHDMNQQTLTGQGTHLDRPISGGQMREEEMNDICRNDRNESHTDMELDKEGRNNKRTERDIAGSISPPKKRKNKKGRPKRREDFEDKEGKKSRQDKEGNTVEQKPSKVIRKGDDNRDSEEQGEGQKRNKWTSGDKKIDWPEDWYVPKVRSTRTLNNQDKEAEVKKGGNKNKKSTGKGKIGRSKEDGKKRQRCLEQLWNIYPIGHPNYDNGKLREEDSGRDRGREDTSEDKRGSIKSEETPRIDDAKQEENNGKREESGQKKGKTCKETKKKKVRRD